MYKSLHLFFVTIVCLLSISCNVNRRILVLKIEHAYNDLDGKRVFYKGLEVGRYNEIEGTEYDELVINDDKILISKNSKLTLSDKLNDELIVEILKGDNEINFKESDTIFWHKSHEEIDFAITI